MRKRPGSRPAVLLLLLLPTCPGLLLRTASAKTPCSCAEGHGICLPGTSACFCAAGWTGPTCAVQACHPRCSEHGKCVDSDGGPGVPKQCKCDRGWSGASCDKSVCPNNCFAEERRGFCVDVGKHTNARNETTSMKECYCHPHYTGVDCGSKRCMVPRGCGSHGTCVASVKDGDFLDKCACKRGWNGTRCEKQTCAHDCLNGGVCGPDFRCVCHLGFRGPRCDRQVTEIPEGGLGGSGGSDDTNNTSTSGSTDTSPATLPALPNQPGVTGPKPGDCEHGMWKLDDKETTASCDCDSGWDGEHCSRVTCPGDDGPCNGNGVCDLTTTPANPTCTCKLGWFGVDCATLPCPRNCGKDEEDGKHGECISDKCVCSVEWDGPDCMTPTSVRTDLPCSQDCPSDCEHAVDCEQYELRYWVPIWHKEALTTDRLYSWVTPGTGKNLQYELNEAKSLNRPVPMDDQNYGEQARQCYLGCVERCVARCFNALHMMTGEERRQLVETQNLAKRLPGITGNKILDIDAEIKRENKGLAQVHHDYTASQIVEYLEKLTKATEGGVKDQLPKGDNPVVVNSAGDASFKREGATGATGVAGAEAGGSVEEVVGAATMQAAGVEAGTEAGDAGLAAQRR